MDTTSTAFAYAVIILGAALMGYLIFSSVACLPPAEEGYQDFIDEALEQLTPDQDWIEVCGFLGIAIPGEIGDDSSKATIDQTVEELWQKAKATMPALHHPADSVARLQPVLTNVPRRISRPTSDVSFQSRNQPKFKASGVTLIPTDTELSVDTNARQKTASKVTQRSYQKYSRAKIAKTGSRAVVHYKEYKSKPNFPATIQKYNAKRLPNQLLWTSRTAVLDDGQKVKPTNPSVIVVLGENKRAHQSPLKRSHPVSKLGEMVLFPDETAASEYLLLLRSSIVPTICK